MEEKSINQVFAENLAASMGRKGLNQVSLAAKSGVSQKTVSNCLTPGNRVDTSTGKESSVSLTNLQLLANALDAEPWQLLRPLDQQKREIYDKFDELLRMVQSPPQSPAADVISMPDKPKVRARGGTVKHATPANKTNTARAA